MGLFTRCCQYALEVGYNSSVWVWWGEINKRVGVGGGAGGEGGWWG